MALTRGTAVALVFVVAAGCGGGKGGGGLSDSAGARRRMPSCGTFTATEDALTAEEKAVRQCFLAAFRDGTQKEVTVTAPSMEGDPIVTIYRVLGPGDLELFVDASADKFADVKTYHQRCSSVAEGGNGLAAGGCVPV